MTPHQLAKVLHEEAVAHQLEVADLSRIVADAPGLPSKEMRDVMSCVHASIAETLNRVVVALSKLA
jgi:hypothetical protein